MKPLSALQYLQPLANSSWFAYLTILLLELKRVWRMWDYLDLTFGDTSSYYQDAYSWFSQGMNDIAWSPLYTAYFGTFLHVFSDATAVTVAHRLVIVFTSTGLFLAVARRLLPPGIAWLMSCWWVLCPNNFDADYEVHMFAVLPVLAAAALVLYWQSPWGRGASLGMLVLSTVLVRNETIVAIPVLLVVYGLWEVKHRTALKQCLWGYVTPLVLVLALVGFFYLRSYDKFPMVENELLAKDTVNICQVYAISYQQRHPQDPFSQLSPWTQCDGLMKRQFGQPYPSLFQAIAANPGAMAEHFLWNSSLTLNGLQIALFGATSGKIGPGFSAVQPQTWVVVPTLGVGMVLIAGVMVGLREGKFWWREYLQGRILGWAVLGSCAAITLLIMIPVERPRPEYLYNLTLFLTMLTGMSLHVLGSHVRPLQRGAALMPVVIALVILFTPNYYAPGERPLADLYHTFLPYQSAFANPQTYFLSRSFPSELCSYLGHGHNQSCNGVDYYYDQNSDDVLYGGANAKVPIPELLERLQVTLAYFDFPIWSQLSRDPRGQEFLDHLDKYGWSVVLSQEIPNNHWVLLGKS